MNKKLIAGNWKMNLLRREARELARSLVQNIDEKAVKCKVMIAPPYTSLDCVKEVISGSIIELGAQDVFWEPFGAFTGEVSPPMLVDVGCSWVIVGHSERRHILGETDEHVGKKIKAALDFGLKVIVCVGETLNERKAFQVESVLERQISKAMQELEEVPSPDCVVIAYEPVWAIGTGEHASLSQIEEAHHIIMNKLIEHFGKTAHNIKILYGGSVNEDNAQYILRIKNVGGVLVGGASLKAKSFLKIINSCGE